MKLNSYDLSREWFNFCFDNPEKIRPLHTAILFFAIEHCNRLGWKEKFGFPSQMVMDAIGVKNWHTYSKGLNDLVGFGYIKMIQKSKNQYSSNIISIKVGTPKNNEALDKALSKHSTKQPSKHHQSTVSIDKQTNKLTINKPTIEKIPLFEKWLTYRTEIKKPVKVKSTLDSLVKKFNTEPLEKIEFVINASIQNGWTGLFWDKYEKQKQQNKNDNGQFNQNTIDLANW